MTYPYSDCCPNLPGAGPGCDDGWCCIHETSHDASALEAASAAVEDWCRANPANFEPVAPAPGFGPAPQRTTVSYLRAERTITLIEPVTVSKYTAKEQPGCTSLPYVHIYEECPAVKRALARDGEVMRSRASVDAFLSPPAARPCGVCLRWWSARGSV